MTPPRELVVFLPSVGGDATFWRPQVEALRGRYATLALDLQRPAPEVSMAAFADEVAAAILGAGYARAHVVGLSMGGVVAQELFRRHPGRVRSLTLCNSWTYMEDGADRLAWVQSQLESKSVAEFSRMSLPGLFAPTTPQEVIEHAIRVESRKARELYLACWRSMVSVDLRSVARSIDVPTLLIGGPLDTGTPTTPLLRLLHELVPTSRLVDLPGAAHFSNLDQPEAFNRVLLAFLRGARAHGDDRLAPPLEETTELPAGTTAEHLLRMLALRGVEVFSSNSGTDFTPLIDAMAALDERSFPLRVVACPHENTSIALAHGHTLLSGKPQVVMGHVHVGTANMGLGLINARRARIPMLALAGRTPLYEEGMEGVRTNFVQWGQESFDQAASFREFTKWDYELRGPHALDTVVDRALAISQSHPAGPVYLTLPKEPLCQPAPARTVAVEARQQPARASLPDEASLHTAREWIGQAKRPLIITADVGRHAGAAEALVALATAAGAGVIEHGKRNFFNFPTEHPNHLGFEPLPHVAEADLVLAVECPVPWIPSFARLARAPRVIQIGVDPLFSDLPMRGFPCDLSLAGDPVETLRALHRPLQVEAAPARNAELGRQHQALFGKAREAAEAQASHSRITKAYLSRCIGRAIDDDVVIFNEYNLDPLQVPRRVPHSWFENSVSSGLGWSLGAALGAKLAAPEKTIMVTLGDGSYLFNTPLSAHYVAAAERLPIIIVVFNDSAWSTIKKSTRGSHPRGASVTRNRFALCDFSVDIGFERVAESVGGIGLRVETPAQVPGALEEALRLARTGERHVLLNVVCERDA